MTSTYPACVVDTNVPLAANGSSDASDVCMLACIDCLVQIVTNGHVVLDNLWLILGEYMNKLDPSNQRGMGNEFLKWVLNNQANADRCTLVPITQKSGSFQDGTPLDFEEFPDHPDLRDFVPSDRKFVAVAFVHPEHPPILNATDTDWLIAKEVLAKCGVRVVFICPEIEEVHRRKAQKGS